MVAFGIAIFVLGIAVLVLLFRAVLRIQESPAREASSFFIDSPEHRFSVVMREQIAAIEKAFALDKDPSARFNALDDLHKEYLRLARQNGWIISASTDSTNDD